ncbi:hypothetical protein BDB01DRAFT_773448 [Pilobolus umbonatus]|nr:hypothetical protein BDB01DRAFT_773448 [Pilobolus umbonatus]
MKSIHILALIAVFTTAASAQCSCSSGDYDCLNKCVSEGNSCISSCRDNNCYFDCIANYWPGIQQERAKVSKEDPIPSKGSPGQELLLEKPAIEEPATEEPATEEPATEEPATEEPTTEESSKEKASQETSAHISSTQNRATPTRISRYNPNAPTPIVIESIKSTSNDMPKATSMIAPVDILEATSPTESDKPSSESEDSVDSDTLKDTSAANDDSEMDSDTPSITTSDAVVTPSKTPFVEESITDVLATEAFSTEIPIVVSISTSPMSPMITAIVTASANSYATANPSSMASSFASSWTSLRPTHTMSGQTSSARSSAIATSTEGAGVVNSASMSMLLTFVSISIGAYLFQ